MNSGVYKIKNIVNGKFYIGSSADIDYRWESEHRCNLRKGIHANPKLQHAWDFYGEDKFIIEVVEETKPDTGLLLEREQHYLDLLKPYERNVGYNICPTAGGGDTFTHNPNKQKIIDNLSKMNIGYKNPMFGKRHSKSAIRKQKDKSVGRYTLPWFIEKWGVEIGNEKFQERRIMLMNRKMDYATVKIPEMSFKGLKHGKEYYERRKHTEEYFKNNWSDFVGLVKSGKYSQRQLSTMLDISRPTLKKRMRQALGQ